MYATRGHLSAKNVVLIIAYAKEPVNVTQEEIFSAK